MLTDTFAEPLAYIIHRHLPPPAQRQTLLFTATLSAPVLELAEKQPAPGKLKPVVHVCGPRGSVLPFSLSLSLPQEDVRLTCLWPQYQHPRWTATAL